MKNAEEILVELKSHSDPIRAAHSAKYFKTGPGEYGEGDRFLGLKVPQTRKLVRKHRGTKLPVIKKLLYSEWHESRLFALLAMVDSFRRGSDIEKNKIYNLYMDNTERINGWDLVDSSAPHIAGAYLWNKDRSPLYEFARSNSLWKRRIAILATQHFIGLGSYEDTLKIAGLLLNDKEDLIHKAAGWMLREVGNKDRELEESFLKKCYTVMPRTMLRYAIEKFDPETRRKYLKGLIKN